MNKHITLLLTTLAVAATLAIATAACHRNGPTSEERSWGLYSLQEAPFGSFGSYPPGPFSPRFGVSFTVDTCQSVLINLFDVRGQSVMTVLDSTVCRGGWFVFPHMPDSLRSGTYFFEVSTADTSVTIKGIHLR